ncbi:MAG: universal stress protein [Burkholderiaceae bacterium]|nr:universal stress protein [Burkholderiaceae bacterium]
MSYRVINVFLSQGKDIERVSEFAVGLAGSFSARLCVQFMEYVPATAQDPYGQAAQMMALVAESNRTIRERAKNAFASLADRNGVHFDWRVVASSAWQETVPAARTSDLVVMGQPNPDDKQAALGMGMAGHVLLQSGRPVIFLPYAMPAPTSYGQAVIAWDGSRPAARAISDALPLLHSAEKVTILSATKEKEAFRRFPDADLGIYLAEHELNVEIVENSNTGIDAGNWILSSAADLGADLLVMGAYGHSRFGEMILGGATRTVLQSMTLPTIMSH